MENKAHAFAAGMFVLVVSALLVALAAWLTRDTGVRRIYQISSAEAVNGLQSQAPVRYRGVAVGKVTAIGFDPRTMGNVLVTIALDDAAPVTRSTYASLGFQGVTGLAFVQLDDSGESKVALDALTDGAPSRIPMRASLLSKLSDQGVAILGRIEETSMRVNQLLSPANQKDLMATINSFGQAADGVQRLSVRVQQLSGTMDGILNAQLGPDRVNVPQFVQDATGAIKSLQKTAEGVDQTVAEFGRTAVEFRKTATEITRLSERLNAQGGVVDKLAEGAGAMATAGSAFNTGTLPRLNRTSEEAARTARQVSRAVSAVGDNPQSLLFGNGVIPPGPGEPGFSFPKGTP
jgi:phospholipid/cholesterol/gamma-HCH transport system substrate-binding protein